MHIIAGIEDPVVIRKILNHLQEKTPMDSGVQIQAKRRHNSPSNAAWRIRLPIGSLTISAASWLGYRT